MSEERNYTDIPIPKVTPEELLTRKKHRIFDTVAKVMTLLIAFLFWLYVIATNDATKVEEKKFEVVPLEVRGSETVVGRGLAVQDMSFFNLDVTLKGTRSALSSVDAKDITAYIDISDVTERGVYTRAIRYSIPSGVAVSESTGALDVEVTVDTIAIKTFVVGTENVYLDNFSLADSCMVDAAGITLGIDYVKLEAPTMLLDRIASVRIRSTEHLNLSTNTTFSATVEAIDQDGEVVTATGLKITASLKGVVKDDFTITVPILREKLLPVVISEKHATVGAKDIVLSPAYLSVKGSPEAMASLTSLTLSPFSAETLVTDADGKVTFSASFSELPSGVEAINLQDGTPFDGKITVTVTMSKEKELSVPSGFVKLPEGFEVADETVTLKVRSYESDSYIALLQTAINENTANLTLGVSLDGKTLSGDTALELAIVLPAEYTDKLYIVYPDGDAYTVTVRPTP